MPHQHGVEVCGAMDGVTLDKTRIVETFETCIYIIVPGSQGAGAPREMPGRFGGAARPPREVQDG